MKQPNMEDYLYYLAAYEERMPLGQLLRFSNEANAWKELMLMQRHGLVRVEASLLQGGDIFLSLTEKGRGRANLAAEAQIEAMLSDWHCRLQPI